LIHHSFTRGNHHRMTCSIPLPHHCSSTRTISRPAPLWLPQRLSIHPPFQRPDRSHIPSVGDEPKRITQLSSPVPHPRLSPLYPTTGLPDSLVLILAVPNLSLRTRVPEIAMRPSEDCPNARSNLKTDLALLPTSYQMRRPPVCPFFVHPFYIRITDPSFTQPPRSPLSNHQSWPPPHGNSTSPILFRRLRPTPPRNSTSPRLPRRPVKNTQTSAPPRKRSVSYLIFGSPIFNRDSPLFPEIQAYVSGCQGLQGERVRGLHAHPHPRRY